MIEGTSTFLERRCSEACINTASSNVVLEFEILLRLGLVGICSECNARRFVDGTAQCSPYSFPSVTDEVVVEFEIDN